ncbi:signal peptide peptidase SppA [Ekhidna sp.]
MAFLRNLLATLLGLIIFTFLGFFMLVGLIASASTDEVPSVKTNSVLYFPMSGILMEKAVEDPFLNAFGDGPSPQSLLDIVTAIERAKTDDRIKGIYLEPMYMAGSYAGLKEIRDALVSFKESGKFIYAYGEYISESDYYVASVADSLFINPTGAIEFNGLSANITFYKGMFDKLDIKPEVFRVGDFKSYVEPYIRKDMSEANRLQYTELLNSMYGTYLEGVSNSIQIPVDKLSEISSQMVINLPQDAVDVGLIHSLGYEDELKSVIKEKLGLRESAELRTMKMNKYIQATSTESAYSSNRIAVIVAEGNITMGGDEGIVGHTFAKEIRKARNNDKVKAIVMRVNSGGGSMTASDMIWRELMLTKGKKPIIASMGGAAASGGYYIAMPADTILAQPNTITGSIGIFGMWFNFGEFLENKVGITHDVVKTGDFSDIYTVTRPLRDAERAIIQRGVNEGYEVFTQKVADARGKSQEEIKRIASGRVWSGSQAVENGLVDQLGDFNDAIELAAIAAGIENDYSIAYYPKQKPFIEEIVEKMNAKIQFTLFGIDADPLVQKAKQLHQLKGLQARLPGDLKVE